MEEYRIDPTIAYDVVELPSRGIHYANKKKSARVAYLTATDEDVLSSQNLKQSKGVIAELLKRKILDHDITFEELIEEDRQAILIFLRNTAWGSEYKMRVLDPKTNEPFEQVIDLSTVKMREFNLVQDANGEFPYHMEMSKADITFKFLTQPQEDELTALENSWKGNGPAPVVTKRLEYAIKSVAGIRDPMQIHAFIGKMLIKDSQDFRKYMDDNKPGLDLKVTVTTPSGENIQAQVGFGVEFFRPFFGV